MCRSLKRAVDKGPDATYDQLARLRQATFDGCKAAKLLSWRFVGIPQQNLEFTISLFSSQELLL
jgi:hypothetical protein